MKVILLEELKGRGVEGDVIDVADGFANNFLLPNKLAVRATKGNLKQLEQRRHNIEKREAQRVTFANELKEKLDGLTLQIDVRVGEEGQLFGSVTTTQIAAALKEQHGLEVDRKLIDVKAPIKTSGEHEAVVSLHRDVKATVKMIVGDPEVIAAQQAEREAEEAAAIEAAAQREAEAAEAAAAEAAEAEAAEATEAAAE